MIPSSSSKQGIFVPPTSHLPTNVQPAQGNQGDYAQRVESMNQKIFNQHIPNQTTPTYNVPTTHIPQQQFPHSPSNTGPYSFATGPSNNSFPQPNQYNPTPYPNTQYQQQSPTYPTSNTQTGGNFFGTKKVPDTKPPSAQHIPINFQRANLTHVVSYEEKKPQPDIKEKKEEEEDGKFDLLRISMIESTFINNPYYYHMDHKPVVDQQIKPQEKNKIDEEEAEKERERLRKKVFAFFSNAGADFSEYIRLLAQLKTAGQKYTDNDFPPNLTSLIGKNQMRKAEWGGCIWLRPDDFYGPGNYKIFQGKIEPNDIKQGELGDCYFLSTLSSLAEWPRRVEKIFGTKEVNGSGCYCVKVCEMGEWKEVVIDDYFPCDKYTRKPIFTRGNDNELWVLILEKVWAKIYGSYDAIEAGLTRECLHDFTGAPTMFFLTDRKEEWGLIWDNICEAEEKQYAMTCGAGDFFSQNGVNTVNAKGIVSSHAYSLLSAHTIQTSRGTVRLVKLRNPWGKTEWTGAWSDSSPLWTYDLKRSLGVENKDDGIFFMAYEDFLQYFTDIQFCYIHDNYQYHNLRVASDPRHAVYFKLKIETEGTYFITVNQQSKRKNADNAYFRYSSVSIVVGKILPNQQFEYITGNNRADREVWAKGLFTPGEYLVYAKVQWSSGRNSDFVLSSYGPSKASIEVVNKQAYPMFLEKTFITKAKKSSRKLDYAREGEANCFSVVDISKDGFIFCYYLNNSSRTLEDEVYFKEFRGIKLRKPYRGRTFKIVVPPRQDKIVLLRILPNEDVRQVITEKVRFITGGGSVGSEGSPYNTYSGGGGNIPSGGDYGQKLVNMDREAIENGEMKRVKDTLTDSFTQIYIYKYKHDDGIYLLFDNKTRDLILETKVGCDIFGLEPIGMTGIREIEFKLYPGSSHRISFKKTSSNFDGKFRFESKIRQMA